MKIELQPNGLKQAEYDELVDLVSSSFSQSFGSCMEEPYKWVGRKEQMMLVQTGGVNDPASEQHLYIFSDMKECQVAYAREREQLFKGVVKQLVNASVPTLPTSAAVAAALELTNDPKSLPLKTDSLVKDALYAGYPTEVHEGDIILFDDGISSPTRLEVTAVHQNKEGRYLKADLHFSRDLNPDHFKRFRDAVSEDIEEVTLTEEYRVVSDMTNEEFAEIFNAYWTEAS